MAAGSTGDWGLEITGFPANGDGCCPAFDDPLDQPLFIGEPEKT